MKGFRDRTVVVRLASSRARDGSGGEMEIVGDRCASGASRSHGLGAVALLTAGLVLLLGAASAHGATFLVTNTTDPAVISPHDGSLREAITQANASSDSTNTISISATGVINLQSALPLIVAPMEIEGPGAASLDVRRQNGGSYAIFSIQSLAPVEISGLTVSNGSTSDGGGIHNRFGPLTLSAVTVSGNTSSNSGGGVYNNNGTLTVTDSTISGNTSGSGGGGGIVDVGPLTVNESTISGNTSGSGDGGGISAQGPLTVTDSTISGNTASAGAGIFYSGGTATITGSSVSKNTAGDRAGGILNAGLGTVMTIDSSTVSGNTASGGSGGGGGGIQNDGTGAGANPPALTVVNSTVAGNVAAHNGGGIDTFDLDSSPIPAFMPTTTVASSTVAENQAGPAGGGLNEFQGNYIVRNSIVASNTATANPDCSNSQPNSPDFASQGYNLVGTTTGCTGFGFTGGGDLLNVPAHLGPLALNGGVTQAIALQPGSPALHAGNPATPGSGELACPAVDQRGRARGGGAGRCDIGAVQPGPPTIMITTPANGATFAIGQTVVASYSCTADPSTTISSCSGRVANGAPIDSSTLGAHAFTVNATDALGTSATQTSDFTVATTPLEPKPPLKPQITKTKISSGKRKARFNFTDAGTITGYQCALIKRGKKRSQPHFTSCRSPKAYKHLKPGKYTFEVRALIGTLAGPAATRKFTM